MALNFVPYNIVLDDATQVAALNAANSRWNKPRNDPAGALLVQSDDAGVTILGGVGKLFCGPDRAVVEFPGCTIHKMGGGTPVTALPYLWSMWIWNDNSDTYPLDVDTWTVSNPDFDNPVTSTPPRIDRYIWVGRYVLDVVPPVTPPTDTYQQVRWTQGFEFDNPAAEGATAGPNRGSVEASRHLGGLGYYVSEETSGNIVTMLTNTHRTAAYKPPSSWERLYIRIRTLPTVPFHFWTMGHSAGGSRGLSLAITPTGQIAMFNQTGVGAYNLLATSAVQSYGDNAAWVKLDVFAVCASGALARFWVNGVEEFLITGFPDAGWGQLTDGSGNPPYHITSSIGNTATVTTGICMHFDDWSNHDIPAFRDEQDVLSGTRVVRLKGNAFGATHSSAVWGTDTVEHLNPNPYLSGDTDNYFTATDATQAPITVLFDINEVTNELPRNPQGGIIHLQGHIVVKLGAGGTTGSLDYSVEGAAFVAQAISETTAFVHRLTAYQPSALTDPEVVTTFALKYVPGASAHLRTVASIGATALIVGRFSPCDVPYAERITGAVPNIPPDVGQQNHAYPRSPWSDYDSFPPPAPIVVISGTYTGNGTTTELTFEYPVNFFKVRRVTATIADGAFFFPSMASAAEGIQEEQSSEGASEFRYALASPPPAAGSGDPLGEVTITIIGADARSNENAIVYQYFAVCDPGGRFTWVDSVKHGMGTTTRTQNLYRGAGLATDWTPEVGFFHKPTAVVTTGAGMWFKGFDSGTKASLTTVAETATAIEWAAGQVITYSAFHFSAGSSSAAIPLLLFRRQDWTDEDGGRVLQIFSYTGDGSASRTISLTVTGDRPVWAWIQPSNAAAIFRDAGHLGVTSSQVAIGGSLTANASTGITGGGIDQINVGSALNANGIVYRCLVFMGDDCLGNGGFSCDGTFEKLPPVYPPCRDAAGAEIECPCVDLTEDDIEDCGDCTDCECADDDCECVGDDCDCVGEDCPGCDPEVEDCNPDECDPEVEECVEFGTQCVTASQKVCNEALAIIGVSQVLVSVVTDTTVEGQQCRLHYASAVDELLRVHPWDFATKYSDLLWLDGDDDEFANYANQDWIFSYRMPDDLVFARRIVRSGTQREYDADPPMFRQGGNDGTGQRLFTNYSDPEWTATVARPFQVTLEYTYRPTCVASHADAMTRSALVWLVASKLAASLSRNKVTAQDCLQMYYALIRQAATVNARQQQPSVVSGDPDWITGR